MTLKMKIPFLSPAQLDSAVAELLRRYARWKGAPPRPPMDVDDIIEGFLGLSLEVDDLEEELHQEGVLGATWFDEKRVVIDQSLEGEGREGRFAFTAAHEVGHWQLHRPLYEADKVTLPLFTSTPAGKSPPAIVCRAGAKEPAEKQADLFAARLLMPALDVRATVQGLFGDELPGWEGLDALRAARAFDPRLRDLAEAIKVQGKFSNVSNEAMRYRLLDLGLVSDPSSPQQRMF